MHPHPRARWASWACAAAAAFCLYLFGLTRTGLLSADEPRYAAIGREMARGGDWVTPRLWGEPWFEKPALLYWMTAAGFKLGLAEDLAPRLPVALLSVAFLVAFWFALRQQYGDRPAWYATAILGTSTGWLVYSHIAVTDLPLSVCLAGSMLLVMGDGGRKAVFGAGILLGLAILAKGLVPLMLFLPALGYWRRRIPDAVAVAGIAMIVAAPWYVLVTLQNGMPFVNEFFIKHHFARFSSDSLQHVQPIWFFAPVLLAALFPWTPVIGVLFHRELYAGRRERFLLAWLVFGFVFFSLSRNKLPGYLLPLLPPLAALMGLGLARAKHVRWMLALSAGLLWLIPAIAAILPGALLNGISRTPLGINYGLLLPMIGLAAMVWAVDFRRGRDVAVAVICSLMSGLIVWVIWNTYPVLDRTISARAFWREQGPQPCVDAGSRAWRYSLNYYAGKTVENCNHLP